MIFNPYNNEHEAQLFTNAETYAKSTLFLNIYKFTFQRHFWTQLWYEKYLSKKLFSCRDANIIGNR